MNNIDKELYEMQKQYVKGSIGEQLFNDTWKDCSDKTSNNINPNHYKLIVEGKEIEVKDLMICLFGEEKYANFALLNTFKYLTRHELKNGVEDLKKARYYLDDYIKYLEQR